MRDLRVRNASIYATLNGRNLDFEIRTTKDSAQGFEVYVDDQCLLNISVKEPGSRILVNDPFVYKVETKKNPLLRLEGEL